MNSSCLMRANSVSSSGYHLRDCHYMQTLREETSEFSSSRNAYPLSVRPAVTVR